MARVETTTMARVKSEKAASSKMAAPVEDPSPAQWVPHFRCVNHFKCPVQDNMLVHTRGGLSDAAHGAVPLADGRFRITYQISRACTPGAFGMVVGVADCSPHLWNAPDAVTSKEIQAICQRQATAVMQPRVAWGLCPSSGKLLETHNVRAGHMQGAMLGKQLVG